MSRTNKGIRDLVKDSRIGSEVRIPSSHSSSNNLTGGIISSASMSNAKMAKISSNAIGQKESAGIANSVMGGTGKLIMNGNNNNNQVIILHHFIR